jgi:predicted amidohydrolase YtcJ
MGNNIVHYVNGNIITMEQNDSDTNSFAVMGGLFIDIDPSTQLKKFASNGAKVIDLCGQTVVPGFIDPHSHISIYAIRNKKEVNCSLQKNKTISDVIDTIATKVQSINIGEWIIGYGYDDTLIHEKRHLSKNDLDIVAPKNPVLVYHTSGHLYYVNSLALSVCGIDKHTPLLEKSTLAKEPDGELSGILNGVVEFELVGDHFPKPDKDEYLKCLPDAIKHYHQHGITSCHDAAIGVSGEQYEPIKAYLEMEKVGDLNLRIYANIIEKNYHDIIASGLLTGHGSDFLKLGSVKLIQDGAIQALSAALKQPYFNNADHCGELTQEQETLDKLIISYHDQGCQVAIHANGDRAIESALISFENAEIKTPKNGRNRHMIIHCQTVSDDQLVRMKKIGIWPNFFINHVYYWGDRHKSIFLGPERARRISPLKTSLDIGLSPAIHSDLPVTPVDPIFSIHTAVNRLTRQGKVLGPEQRISPIEALKAYTVNAAHLSFEENIKGSIKPGKLADFVILSDNPLTVASEKIKDIHVKATYVGGKEVYRRQSN